MAAEASSQELAHAEPVLTPTEQWMVKHEGVAIDVGDDGRRMFKIDRELAGKVNLMFPVSSVITVDPNWSPLFTMVRLTPGQDSYKVGSKKIDGSWVESHALTSTALARLADRAGIQPQRTETKRFPGGIEITVHARRRGPDGLTQYAHGTVDDEWELMEERLRIETDEKAEKSNKPKMSDREFRKYFLQQRGFAIRTLETKAYSRAIKKFFGISTFTLPELQRPFLVQNWLMTPDYSRPGTHELVKLQYAQSVAELFGPSEEGVTTTISSASHLSYAEIDDDLPPDGGEVEVLDARGPEEQEPADEADADWDIEPDADEGRAEPKPPKPAQHFTLKGSTEWAGKDIEEVIADPNGRLHIASVVLKTRSAERRKQGLEWLSWAEGVVLSVDMLEES